MKDIESQEDIVLLVDAFYAEVQKNELLAPVFNKHLANKWDVHHEKLYRFWQTVLFKEKTYSGKPHKLHDKMVVSSNHFDLWIKIWQQTVDVLFVGDVAERAKYRGQTMADSFFEKIQNK